MRIDGRSKGRRRRRKKVEWSIFEGNRKDQKDRCDTHQGLWLGVASLILSRTRSKCTILTNLRVKTRLRYCVTFQRYSCLMSVKSICLACSVNALRDFFLKRETWNVT